MQHQNFKAIVPAMLTAALVLPCASAMAVEQGDWLVRGGVGHVSPNDSSGDVCRLRSRFQGQRRQRDQSHSDLILLPHSRM